MRARLWPAAVALLAAACSHGSAPDITLAPPSSTDTVAPSPSAPVTTVTLFGPTTTRPAADQPAADPPAADPAQLAAIVLFPEDLPDPYHSLPLRPAASGFRPAGATLSSALEPDDEADDIVRFGLLGDFTTTYGSTATHWISFEAAAFIDPAGAGSYLADWQDDLARRTAAVEEGSDLLSFTPAPDPTAADEAVRARYALAASDPDTPPRNGVVRVVRSGAILAWIWAVGEDPAAAVDVLAPLIENRLLSVLDGESPPRDPDALGLARSPIELLESFAFTYSYGIETAAPGGGFLVQVSGEFRAPDRTSCRVSLTAGAEATTISRLVAIGTRVWLVGTTGYQEIPLRHPSALADLPLCPGHPLFWEDTGYHRLPIRDGVPDTLAGRPVLRSDLATDPAILEELGYSPLRAARVTHYRVARAVDGNWPVAVEVEEETTVGSARQTFGLAGESTDGGLPATIFTRLQLTRIDDPAIQVEPPLTAG